MLTLIKNLGLEQHLTHDRPTVEEEEDPEDSGKGATTKNQQAIWFGNDGLFTSWLLGIIYEDILAVLESIDKMLISSLDLS